MAQVIPFRTRTDHFRQERLRGLAEELRALSLEDLRQLPVSDRASVEKAIYALHRVGRSHREGLWSGGFVMLSRDQTKFVWDQIRALPSRERPGLVKDAFMVMMLNIRQDTGEVMLTRDELAAELHVAPGRVSTVMSTLERMGVVRRDLTRVEGFRGRVVTYIVNANVGWNGNLDIRKVEAEKMRKPSLRLVKTQMNTVDE